MHFEISRSTSRVRLVSAAADCIWSRVGLNAGLKITKYSKHLLLEALRRAASRFEIVCECSNAVSAWQVNKSNDIHIKPRKLKLSSTLPYSLACGHSRCRTQDALVLIPSTYHTARLDRDCDICMPYRTPSHHSLRPPCPSIIDDVVEVCVRDQRGTRGAVC